MGTFAEKLEAVCPMATVSNSANALAALRPITWPYLSPAAINSANEVAWSASSTSRLQP